MKCRFTESQFQNAMQCIRNNPVPRIKIASDTKITYPWEGRPAYTQADFQQAMALFEKTQVKQGCDYFTCNGKVLKLNDLLKHLDDSNMTNGHKQANDGESAEVKKARAERVEGFLQEVFYEALKHVPSLSDPNALALKKAWEEEVQELEKPLHKLSSVTGIPVETIKDAKRLNAAQKLDYFGSPLIKSAFLGRLFGSASKVTKAVPDPIVVPKTTDAPPSSGKSPETPTTPKANTPGSNFEKGVQKGLFGDEYPSDPSEPIKSPTTKPVESVEPIKQVDSTPANAEPKNPVVDNNPATTPAAGAPTTPRSGKYQVNYMQGAEPQTVTIDYDGKIATINGNPYPFDPITGTVTGEGGVQKVIPKKFLANATKVPDSPVDVAANPASNPTPNPTPNPTAGTNPASATNGRYQVTLPNGEKGIIDYNAKTYDYEGKSYSFNPETNTISVGDEAIVLPQEVLSSRVPVTKAGNPIAPNERYAQPPKTRAYEQAIAEGKSPVEAREISERVEYAYSEAAAKNEAAIKDIGDKAYERTLNETQDVNAANEARIEAEFEARNLTRLEDDNTYNLLYNEARMSPGEAEALAASGSTGTTIDVPKTQPDGTTPRASSTPTEPMPTTSPGPGKSWVWDGVKWVAVMGTGGAMFGGAEMGVKGMFGGGGGIQEIIDNNMERIEKKIDDKVSGIEKDIQPIKDIAQNMQNKLQNAGGIDFLKDNWHIILGLLGTMGLMTMADRATGGNGVMGAVGGLGIFALLYYIATKTDIGKKNLGPYLESFKQTVNGGPATTAPATTAPATTDPVTPPVAG
jgi:hypothetical protein